MKQEELKIINKLINQLDNLKKLKEEEIRQEENEFEKEIEEEINNDCGEIDKITLEERIIFGKEIQSLIDTYSVCKNNNHYLYADHNEFDTCSKGFSRKLFKYKIFKLCSVIIKKYIDVNYIYFNIHNLEQLVRISDRILKIDYRNEKDATRRIRILIKFCKID